MGRWQPDARGRLAQAAAELYTERGYDATAVAQIAERAGLTERTFFRHYADSGRCCSSGPVNCRTAWSAACAALRERGVDDATAQVAAQAGVAMFKVAFERWVRHHDRTSLRQTLRDSFAELHRLSADHHPTPDPLDDPPDRQP